MDERRNNTFFIRSTTPVPYTVPLSGWSRGGAGRTVPPAAGRWGRRSWADWSSRLRLQKKAPFEGASRPQMGGHIPRRRIWKPWRPKRSTGCVKVGNTFPPRPQVLHRAHLRSGFLKGPRAGGERGRSCRGAEPGPRLGKRPERAGLGRGWRWPWRGSRRRPARGEGKQCKPSGSLPAG